MFGFANKKKVKKSFNETKKAITELTSQSINNRVLIENNKENLVSKKEIDLMIREALLKVQFTPTNTRSPQTTIRRKANKILNKVEIMQEIVLNEQNGLSTMEIYDIVVTQKQMCKKSCFFKYIKIVRERGLQTPRTTQTN